MSGNQTWRNRGVLMSFLVALLLIFGLFSTSSAGESGAFSGSWVANGQRTMASFGETRKIYTFKLSGHVNLKNHLGKQKDYWSECVGLADSETGVIGRCVWKDINGPELYITLVSEQMQVEKRFVGEIVGGTHHLKGITGDLSFVWSSVTFQEDAGLSYISGQTLDLQGSYQLP